MKKILDPIFGILILFSLISYTNSTYSPVAIKDLMLVFTAFSFFLIYCVLYKKIPIFKVDLIVFSLFLFNIILLLFANYRIFSFQFILLQFILIVFYFAVKSSNPYINITILLTVGFISSIYAIFQYYGVDVFNFYESNPFGRPPSFFGNPNFFSPILIVSIMINICAFFIFKGIKPNMISVIILSIQIYAILLTRTRASFVGLAVSVILFFIFSFKWLRLKIKYFFVFSLLIFFIFIVSPKDIFTRIKGGFDIESGTPMFRYYTWRSSLNIARDHPLGVGPGNFRIYYPRYKNKRIILFEQKHNAETIHTHNEFLENAVDGGIFGFFVFLVFVLSFIFLFFRSSNVIADKYDKRYDALLLTALNCAFIGLLVNNFFCVNLKWTSSMIMLFLLLGTAMGILQKYKKELFRFKCISPFLFCFLLLSIVLSVYSVNKYRSQIFLSNALMHSKYAVMIKNKDTNNAVNNLVEADGLYLKSIKLDRSNIVSSYFHGTVNYDLFHLTRDNKFLEKALNSYNEVQKISPDYVQVHFLKGRVYYYLEDLENALFEFRSHLEQDPVDDSTYRFLFSIFDKLNMNDQKEELMSFAKSEVYENLEINPDYRKIYPLMEYVNRDKPAVTINYYKELVEKVKSEQSMIHIYGRLSEYFANLSPEEGLVFFLGVREDIAEINEITTQYIRTIQEKNKE